MNKVLKKAGILAAVFVICLLVFSKMLNHDAKDLTADMTAASLPVVYLMQNETCTGELHGYVTNMDVATMGEDITPVPDNNVIDLQIVAWDEPPEAVSYELRSADGQRLIEEDENVDFGVSEDIVEAELSLQDLMEPQTEYLLVLHLQREEQQIHYYCKIMKEDNCDLLACMEFVQGFHEKTLDKNQASDLSMFLEPSADADNTTLQTVTIQNRLRQISWGDLQVSEVTQPVLTVRELTEDFNVIVLKTTVCAENENGVVDYYNVEEYYKVRQGIERMYLLDYQRTVEEIFQGGADSVNGMYVNLGIRSENVDFWSNEMGTSVSFVQQGDLWSYNQSTNQLVQVYSFRSDSELDVRENYGEHDIRIISADESGSIDFIVYGYMNRGDHEGQVGVSVCHYDSVTNTVEEWLFMPANVSFDVMSESISQLLYINDAGVFFLMWGNAVYAIDLDTKEYKVFLGDLVKGACQVSEDGRYIAWVDRDNVNTSEVMHITDLNTEKTMNVQAKSDCYIKPLGFAESDCIYGYAEKENSSGAVFSTKELIIGQIDGESVIELTSYSKSGCWIKKVDVENGIIRLDLANTGSSKVASQDTITNKELQESKRVHGEIYQTEMKQAQLRFVLAESVLEGKISIKTPKLMLSEESTTLKLEEDIFLK